MVKMRIGIPKETFPDEKRVALTPAGVHQLVRNGHVVYVESKAGKASNFCDEDYRKVGAEIVYSHEEIFQRAEIIAKVAPVNSDEAEFLNANQIIFSFLHLAYDREIIARNLISKKVTAIGYEFIGNDGHFPILETMSEITGQLAIQEGARFLGGGIENSRGILMGGLPGVAPAAVVILGAGVVGLSAARTAIGTGAQVILLDEDVNKLRRIENLLGKTVTTVAANPYTIERGAKFADLFIGAVHISNENKNHLVSEDTVKEMKRGSVIIDVSIDEGGCFETSRPTTISNPVFVKHDIIHYCVPNMPAIVPRSSSYGLTNTTVKYIEMLANNGLEHTLLTQPQIANGIWAHQGFCTNEFLADTFNLEFRRLRIFPTN